jgi:hypothetical protein
VDEVAAVSQTELARVRRIVARRLEKLRKREEESEWLKRRRAEHSDDSDFEDFQHDFAASAVKPASTNKAAAAAAAAAKAHPGPAKRPRKVKLKPTAVAGSTGRSSRKKASPQLPDPSGRASGGASSASTAHRGHLKRTSHSVRPHVYVHNSCFACI